MKLTPELIVVDDIAEASTQLFLEVRPRAIVLAGGQTPIPVYRRLAQEPYPWAEADFFFGDERCVPPDDAASNYGTVHRCLPAQAGARVHRMIGERCDAEGYEQELREFFAAGSGGFDLAFLGIGADGHTASLFPGHPALQEKERLVVRVDADDYPRMTMTLPTLSRARTVIFLVTGPEKRDAVRRVLAGEDVPAARVRAERVVIIADLEAAP